MFILFTSLIILLILDVPIAIALGLSTMVTLIFGGIDIPLTIIPQRMFSSIDSFPFMAIPFFMLAGSIMERGGISRRLINFAKQLVGFMPGSMGVITVVASGFFGAISGSNAATVAAMGKIMIPAMAKDYGTARAGAIVAASGTLGVVMPPSVPMITYGVISGVSIGALFMAGIIPALLMMIALSMIIVFVGKTLKLKSEKFVIKDLFSSFIDSILSLLMPIIILGGIYGGIFTPTESAAVACVYAFIVTTFVYREVSVDDLKNIIMESSKNTAIVFFIIATSSAFAWLLTVENIPNTIASSVLALSENKYIILMLFNIVLLVLGVFLETNAIILLVTPILLPIATQIGVDPLVLGIIIIVNTSIGMITPPMALNIIIAAGIGAISIEDISKKIIPLFLALIAVLLFLTYVPWFIQVLPHNFGNF